MAYKSTLLSSLIQIRYEIPIDTVNDLDKSGLPALVAGGSPVDKALATDPREVIKDIFNRTVIFPYNGTVPQFVWNM